MNETSSSPNDDNHMPVSLAFAQQALQQLSEMYRLLGLEKNGKDFGTEIYFPTLEAEPDPNDLEDELENADGEVSNIDMMKLSCAYVVGAIRAETEGDQENAWVAVSHAQYWLGVAWGSGVMAGLTSVKYRARASAGGKANAEANYGDVKAEARRLAMDHLDGSRRDAAEKIRQALIDFQDKTKPHYPISSVDTIAEWLEGLPFKRKRSPRKPNVKS